MAVTHLWRGAPWRRVVGVIGAALAVAACSSSPSPTPSPRHSPTARGTASPSLITGDAGDPTLLPVPADTPWNQASIALQNEWRSYYGIGAITVIPNTTVPYHRPPTPTVANGTNGAIDDATAQRWGDALMREAAWENWAITANQTSLLDSGEISAPAVTAGISLPQGATSLRIAGSRWPTALRLVTVSGDARSFLKITDTYALIVTFGQGWTVEAMYPDGHAQPLSGQIAAPGAMGFVTGHLDSPADLGELWLGSSSLGCDSNEPAVIQTLCAE